MHRFISIDYRDKSKVTKNSKPQVIDYISMDHGGIRHVIGYINMNHGDAIT